MTVTTEKGYTRQTPSISQRQIIEQVLERGITDQIYRQSSLTLTASENHASHIVRLLAATSSGTFYHFFAPYSTKPGEWFFPDSAARKDTTQQLREQGKALFKSQTFDERPNGGSSAGQAVLLAACKAGDAWVHFDPKDGGHFGSDAISQKVGIQEHFLPIDQTTGLVDIERLKNLLRDNSNIKLVMLDQSHKVRFQPLQAIREVTPPDILLVYDCSHDGGLIIGGVLPQPLLNGADVLIGNTHKTLPGVNKAFIAFADETHPLFKPVSDWVCPRLQSNCHAELSLPFLIALLEMEAFGTEYAQQTANNAQVFAQALVAEGFQVAGEQFGYTETQQVHLIVGSSQEALECVAEILPAAGIRVNNIEIPGLNNTFGLRLGTQAITRRGMEEEHIVEIAKLLARLLLKKESPNQIKLEVESLLQGFPLFPLPYSFDYLVQDELGQALLKQIIQ